MISLGIDTGGTCTDAVLYDSESGKVLSAGKALTTKGHLEDGIAAALDLLEPDQVRRAELVSLSTTLATNACVENRGGRVCLLFIGANRKVLRKVYREYGFDSLEDIRVIDGLPEGGYVDPVPPDWDSLRKMAHEFAGAEAIGIVQSYPQRNSGAFEHRAKEILGETCHVPIVCGSDLFSDRNIIRRGAGTYLNVRLIPVIHEFLEAVRNVLDSRGLNLPVHIVRSDGSLMSEAFAREHPVETLLCGPAASAVGGAWLSGKSDALIVDIGGTTTDVALVRGGRAVTVEEGIRINGWKTFVKGMFVDTFGLGGDSAVRWFGRQIALASCRVIPVAVACRKDPVIREKLENLGKQRYFLTDAPYEGFVLQKEPAEEFAESEWEHSFLKQLKNGPMLLEEAAQLGDRYRLEENLAPLEADGRIMRFGLTPTDMMHMTGDYTEYDGKASRKAAEIFGRMHGIPADALPELVYRAFVDKLVWNLERILLEQEYRKTYPEGLPEELLKFLELTLDQKEEGLLKTEFHSPLPIVGVGGPAPVFLRPAAERLYTSFCLPRHAAVANAVGTLTGRVSVQESLDIIYHPSGKEPGFRVFSDGTSHDLATFEEAVKTAEEYLCRLTRERARQRGARGEITCRASVEKKEEMAGGSLFLFGGTVTVTAAGSMI
jgi:N-methylhydantoinase A/oxoprolinase/acetone carboxylase beta subunit